MSSPLFWPRVIFGLLFVLITFLTLTPNPVETESGFAVTRFISDIMFGNDEYADKIGHYLGYAALGLTAFWARLAVYSKRWVMTVVLALYGVALEGLQGLGGVRSPELADAFANGLGALSGFVAGAALLKLNRFRAQ